ncbi:hypothetical protein [Prauserella rugosa]|uniref:Uncharacterized protein n=1 Tax=Prauserella rugosa TaxID=43354 RepID=A0A660CHF2_9PSEU|nr:hypothetical protein [Prauserella rugosa]TWH21297.1 hypothetical protein JD82_03156 [Prauserella rugosa]
MDVDAALDSVAAELYAVDRDEFVRERDARARATEDRDLAARIRKLCKPTAAAALVNRFVREQPDRVRELRDLGDALRQAHRDLDGVRIRELSPQRGRLVDELSTMVTDGASDTVAREVRETLDAAVADPDTAEEVARGQLVTALHPGTGIGDDDMAAWFASAPASGGTVDTESGSRAKERGKSDRKPEQRRDEKRQQQKRQPDEQRRQEQRLREEQEQEEEQQEEERREEQKRAKEYREKQRREERQRQQQREQQRRLRVRLDEARQRRNAAVTELREAEAAEAQARRRAADARKEFEAADREVSDVETELSEQDS